MKNNPTNSICSIIIIIFIAASIYFINTTYEKDKEQEKQVETSKKENAKEFDISEAYELYNENEVKADLKYKDNYYIIKGKISNIGNTDIDDEPYLTFDYKYSKDKSQGLTIVACFDSKYTYTISNFKKGDEITIKCKFSDKDYLFDYEFYFNTCSIEQ